jgi:hypothetical protein
MGFPPGHEITSFQGDQIFDRKFSDRYDKEVYAFADLERDRTPCQEGRGFDSR